MKNLLQHVGFDFSFSFAFDINNDGVGDGSRTGLKS